MWRDELQETGKNPDALTLHRDRGLAVIYSHVGVELAQVVPLVRRHHVDQGEGEAAAGGLAQALAPGPGPLVLVPAALIFEDPGEQLDVRLRGYGGLTLQGHVGAARRGHHAGRCLQLHGAPYWSPEGGHDLKTRLTDVDRQRESESALKKYCPSSVP